MPTERAELHALLDRLGHPQELSARAMMGEYVLYYEDKVVGGLYDGRLLVKPVAGAKALLPDAPLETPYEGAKPMLRIPAGTAPGDVLAILAAAASGIPDRKPRKPLS